MAHSVQSNAFSFGAFTWWMGVVEDRKDDQKAGRHRVRIFGYHPADKGKVATDKLFWATVVTPISSASISGIGVSPTGILQGSHVFGFFADGADAQVPIIVGTYPGIPEKKNASDDGDGFGDPEGNWPKYPLGEPDTNRLARNEHIDETIIQKKKDGRDKKVDEAFGGTWDEPETKYNAEYPYNHVRETESGHVEEWDDTKNAERYSLWHRKGTFWEIDPEGTLVIKVVKDRYSITMGDDYIHIKGDAQITCDKDAHILVKQDAFLEVKGNMKEEIHGNYTLTVDGNYTVLVKGVHSDTANALRKIVAPTIFLN